MPKDNPCKGCTVPVFSTGETCHYCANRPTPITNVVPPSSANAKESYDAVLASMDRLKKLVSQLPERRPSQFNMFKEGHNG